MKAIIIVTPKKSVLDPQGEAVKRAIHGLGMDCVQEVHIGKYMELEISGSNAALTRAKLEGICRDLLSNPVIEDYDLQMEAPVSKPAAAKAPVKAPAAKRPKAEEKKKSKKEKKKDKKDKKKKKKGKK
jgi:phosphoribosylformylglycinamidine synthase PurS subunit